MRNIILLGLLFVAFQAQAERVFKHGVYLSHSLGDIKADISGKHQDFSGFNGDPASITEKNANIYNGKISSYRSLGYNLRYMPKVGFGYELGVYRTKIAMPKQLAALMHDDGTAFKKPTLSGLVDVVVDSPSSYLETTDIYAGGLYNFAAIKQMYNPYVGLGYAKVKGDWYNSYYSGTSGDPEYGTKDKTGVNGSYISAKAGVNFMQHYNLELEYAKHKFYAQSFRSFNINGSNSSFNRISINFIYNF